MNQPITKGYDTMSYFETIDVEKALGRIEISRKDILREISEIWPLIKDSTEASGLNDLADALEASEKALDAVWDRIAARQMALEDAEPNRLLVA